MPIHSQLTSLSLKTPAGMTGLSHAHPVLNVGVGSLCGFLCPCPVLVRVGLGLFVGAETDESIVVAESASAASGEATTMAVKARATRAKRILMCGSFYPFRSPEVCYGIARRSSQRRSQDPGAND
jgi:hypothetical protein